MTFLLLLNHLFHRVNAVLKEFLYITGVVDAVAAVVDDELIIGIGVFKYLVRIIKERYRAALVAPRALARLIRRQKP